MKIAMVSNKAFSILVSLVFLCQSITLADTNSLPTKHTLSPNSFAALGGTNNTGTGHEMLQIMEGQRTVPPNDTKLSIIAHLTAKNAKQNRNSTNPAQWKQKTYANGIAHLCTIDDEKIQIQTGVMSGIVAITRFFDSNLGEWIYKTEGLNKYGRPAIRYARLEWLNDKKIYVLNDISPYNVALKTHLMSSAPHNKETFIPLEWEEETDNNGNINFYNNGDTTRFTYLSTGIISGKVKIRRYYDDNLCEWIYETSGIDSSHNVAKRISGIRPKQNGDKYGIFLKDYGKNYLKYRIEEHITSKNPEGEDTCQPIPLSRGITATVTKSGSVRVLVSSGYEVTISTNLEVGATVTIGRYFDKNLRKWIYVTSGKDSGERKRINYVGLSYNENKKRWTLSGNPYKESVADHLLSKDPNARNACVHIEWKQEVPDKTGDVTFSFSVGDKQYRHAGFYTGARVCEAVTIRRYYDYYQKKWIYKSSGRDSSGQIVERYFYIDNDTRLFKSISVEEIEKAKARRTAQVLSNLEFLLRNLLLHQGLLSSSAETKKDQDNRPICDVQIQRFQKILGQVSEGSTTPAFSEFLGLRQPQDVSTEEIEDFPVTFFDKDVAGDEFQSAAVKTAMHPKTHVTLIQGGPGSGKTQTVAEIARQMASGGKKVLVVSRTNLAVDNVLLRLNNSGVPIARLCTRRVERKLHKKLGKFSFGKISGGHGFRNSEGGKIFEDRRKETRGSVFGVTVDSMDLLLDNTDTFDAVIIDEAGTMNEFETTLAASRVNARCGKIIIAGDHKQIQPFFKESKIRHDTPEYLEFRKMIKKSSMETRWNTGYPQVFLARNYRSHPALAVTIGRLFYDGLIVPNGSRPLEEDTLRLVDVPPTTNGTAEKQITGKGALHRHSFKNTREANQSVEEFLRAMNSGYKPEQISIIAGYNQQVEIVRTALARRLTALGFDNAREIAERQVNTTDTFQGRENNVIIFSFVRSNPEGNIGHMGNMNRLNVALSRAIDRLIVIGDFSTLKNARNENIRHVVNGLLDRERELKELYKETESLSGEFTSTEQGKKVRSAIAEGRFVHYTGPVVENAESRYMKNEFLKLDRIRYSLQSQISSVIGNKLFLKDSVEKPFSVALGKFAKLSEKGAQYRHMGIIQHRYHQIVDGGYRSIRVVGIDDPTFDASFGGYKTDRGSRQTYSAYISQQLLEEIKNNDLEFPFTYDKEKAIAVIIKHELFEYVLREYEKETGIKVSSYGRGHALALSIMDWDEKKAYEKVLRALERLKITRGRTARNMKIDNAYRLHFEDSYAIEQRDPSANNFSLAIEVPDAPYDHRAVMADAAYVMELIEYAYSKFAFQYTSTVPFGFSDTGLSTSQISSSSIYDFFETHKERFGKAITILESIAKSSGDGICSVIDRIQTQFSYTKSRYPGTNSIPRCLIDYLIALHSETPYPDGYIPASLADIVRKIEEREPSCKCTFTRSYGDNSPADVTGWIDRNRYVRSAKYSFSDEFSSKAIIPGEGEKGKFILCDTACGKTIRKEFYEMLAEEANAELLILREGFITVRHNGSLYRIPSGSSFNNQYNFYRETNLSTVLNFVPARLTVDGRNKLLVDPEYYKLEKEKLDKLRAEKDLDIVFVDNDELHLQMTNFVILDNHIIINNGRNTIAVLCLKEGVVISPDEPNEDVLYGSALYKWTMNLIPNYMLGTEGTKVVIPDPNAVYEEPQHTTALEPSEETSHEPITFKDYSYHEENPDEEYEFVMMEPGYTEDDKKHAEHAIYFADFLKSQAAQELADLLKSLTLKEDNKNRKEVFTHNQVCNYLLYEMYRAASEHNRIFDFETLRQWCEKYKDSYPQFAEILHPNNNKQFASQNAYDLVRSVLIGLKYLNDHSTLGINLIQTALPPFLAHDFTRRASPDERYATTTEISGKLHDRGIGCSVVRKGYGNTKWPRDITSKPFVDRDSYIFSSPQKNLTLSEGGAMVPGKGKEGDFILVSEYVSDDEIAWLKTTTGISEVERIKSGFVTIKNNGTLYHSLTLGHIDSVIGFVPSELTTDNRAKLLVDPQYFNTYPAEGEKIRALALRQGLEIVFVAENDLNLQMPNFSIVEDHIIMNKGDETIKRLKLRREIVITPDNPDETTSFFLGSYRCLTARLPKSMVNRYYYRVQPAGKREAERLTMQAV